MDINCSVNIMKIYGIDMTNDVNEKDIKVKAKLLTDQQLRDMCVKYGWDDSYQSLKAYRTVEAMSLELNQLEK